MADIGTPVTLNQKDKSLEVIQKGGDLDIGKACKQLMIAVCTAAALNSVVEAQEKQPNQKIQLATVSTPAASVPTAAKGYGQYTKDGRKFEDLSDEEVGKLDIREKIAYKKWSIENERQKTIDEQVGLQQDEARNQEIVGKRQDVQANLIKEYRILIKNVSTLHAHGDKSQAFKDAKKVLKGVLLEGKPPEIIPELEKIRDILMS